MRATGSVLRFNGATEQRPCTPAIDAWMNALSMQALESNWPGAVGIAHRVPAGLPAPGVRTDLTRAKIQTDTTRCRCTKLPGAAMLK